MNRFSRKLWLRSLEDRLAPATLSGSVFADYDGDGTRDAIERVVANATVRLDLDSDGSNNFTATTEADGTFSFAGVANGTHKVLIVLPTGFTATTPVSITVPVTADVTSLAFGLQPDGQVRGRIYNDFDFDGVLDVGEPGLSGFAIRLDLFGDGKSIFNTTTDSTGKYSFDGVPIGTHTLTASRDGFVNISANPIGVPVNNAGDFVVNLAFAPRALVSGTVFGDTNSDGALSGQEPLLSGYTVSLDLDNDGDVDRTAVTNSDGKYTFNAVADGQYNIAVTKAGVVTVPASRLVTVSGGASVSGLNFAVPPTPINGRLEGVAFADVNANGVRDTGETPQSGVTVTVDFLGDGSINRSVVTAADGKYSFTDIPDGSHVVAAARTGSTNTTVASLAVTFISGQPLIPPTPGAPTGPRTPGDPVGPAVTFPTTFGFADTAVVTGFVYVDLNKNGTPDRGETELSGVTVKLDGIKTAITDGFGRYAFTGVGTGEHVISIVVPAGYPAVSPQSRTVTIAATGSTGNAFALQTGNPVKVIALSTDSALGSQITTLNGDGSVRGAFPAFSTVGETRVATGDVNGDAIEDYAVATGPGRVTMVRVLDGATGSELFAITPYGNAFFGGAFVALGDITGDGRADLVITPDVTGGPRVRIFSGNGFGQIADFFGIDDVNFRGGARAAVGDMNADGIGDLAVSAGFGGGPRVALFDGARLSASGGPKLIGDFFVFEPALLNGAYVAVGDVNGDGFGDLVTGAGSGGSPRITMYSGKDLLNGTQTRLADFFAGGQVGDRSGARVAIADVDGDARADVVASYRSLPTFASRVAVYPGTSLTTPVFDLEPFAGFLGNVYVG